MKKISVPAGTFLAPVPAVMVSAGDDEKNYNIATASWTGTVSSRPPMTYVSFRPATLTHGILMRTGEFVINLVPGEMTEIMDWCGIRSGRDYDKWKEKKLTPLKAQKVKAPLVAECPVNLECRVTQTLELGSHTMFLAEIVAANCDDSYAREDRIDYGSFKTVVNQGGNYMGTGSFLGRMGFSVRG